MQLLHDSQPKFLSILSSSVMKHVTVPLHHRSQQRSTDCQPLCLMLEVSAQLSAGTITPHAACNIQTLLYCIKVETLKLTLSNTSKTRKHSDSTNLRQAAILNFGVKSYFMSKLLPVA